MVAPSGTQNSFQKTDRLSVVDLTLSSISQVRVAILQGARRMGSDTVAESSPSRICRVSGLTLHDPGRSEREKLKQVKKRDH